MSDLRKFLANLSSGEARELLELLYVEHEPLFDTSDFKQDLFVAHFVECSGNISRALSRTGLGYTTYRAWLEDPVFRGKLRLSSQGVIERLRGVALEKALRGDNEMIKFLLTAEDPEKYDSKVRSQRAANEGQIDALHASMQTFTPEELKAAILEDPAQEFVSTLTPTDEETQ